MSLDLNIRATFRSSLSAGAPLKRYARIRGCTGDELYDDRYGKISWEWKSACLFRGPRICVCIFLCARVNESRVCVEKRGKRERNHERSRWWIRLMFSSCVDAVSESWGRGGGGAQVTGWRPGAVFLATAKSICSAAGEEKQLNNRVLWKQGPVTLTGWSFYWFKISLCHDALIFFMFPEKWLNKSRTQIRWKYFSVQHI